MKITNCKTDHLTNPLGYQIRRPVFSWNVEEAEGKFQTEARILISLREDMAEPLLDTGFCPDINPLAYTADLDPSPCTRYYWTVTVRTDAKEEQVSPVNWFETGKQKDPWSGKWITCDSRTGRHPVFTRTFTVHEAPSAARLYICGLGLYEAYLDGEKIGNEILAPYCCNYKAWVQSQTFAFDQLAPGEHKLCVLLGNGWYKGRYGFDAPELPPCEQPPWRLIAELVLTYPDGSRKVIASDETWTVTRSNITDSSIYNGEIRDDTLPPAVPETAMLLEEPMPFPSDRLSTPVTIRHELPVRQLIHTPAGETVLDLGQNFAGIFRLRVHKPAGTRIRLQFGELLQNGNFFRDNLKSARAEYIYISDGEEHILTPRFTFYGYRYVKIEGITDIRPEDFTGLSIYSDIPRAGTLTTGNEMVNRLIANAEWGLRSNFIDIPTDCPQRDERLGWTGDAQVFSPTACFQHDCYAFYRKYLADMATEQAERNGQVPNVIPAVCEEGAAAAWGDACCIIPWNLYQFYGDLSILEERYSDMKAWVDYITRTDGGAGKWKEQFQWGDWLALDNPSGGDTQVFGGTDEGFIADVFYMNSAHIVSQSAALLGYTEDARTYRELSGKIRKRILHEYYSPSGRCCISTQTAYLLTLKYHLSADEPKARKILRTLFAQKNDMLQTGFVGTPILCNVLSDNGMEDLAYKLLLNEEYPGWLYAVKHGATTIWERWNSLLPDGTINPSGMCSLNHYSYGSIVEWIWRHAAGITQADGIPGFRKVRFCPTVNNALKYAEARYHSAAGEWYIRWEIMDVRHLSLKVKVPFGCTAELVLPFASARIFEKYHADPLFRNMENGVCCLNAGTYEITYETSVPLFARVTTASPIGELRADADLFAAALDAIPALAMLPEELDTQPLRPFIEKFGHNIGITDEMMDDLDRRLAEYQEEREHE